MRTAFLPILAVGFGFSALAETEARKIGEFHALEVRGGVEVTVRQGDGPTLTMTGERDALAAYRTEVKDGVLSIEPVKGLRRRETVRMVVTTPRLDSARASGGVALKVESGTGKELKLEASGGVVITATSLDLDRLELEASGGVKAVLGGRTGDERLDVSGGVDLDARKLSASRVSLDASGGCTLRVHASEAIEGTVSGGVDVKVSGRPANQRVHTSGGSSVENIGV